MLNLVTYLAILVLLSNSRPVWQSSPSHSDKELNLFFPHHNIKQQVTTTKIYQKEVYYRHKIWHWDLFTKNQNQVQFHGWSATIPRMVAHHSKDGHPTSKIFQKEELYRLEISHHDLTHKIWPGEVPCMASHHHKDGHPPSKIKIYQNEEYYRLGIWHLDLIPKIKIR